MTPELGTVPFQEAIAFLRRKLDLPSAYWDDYLGEIHAHAFTVAGATKLDLVAELHASIVAAAEAGESIGDFRKRFDQVVEQHGWSYRGSRGWRTRVLYDTNLRTAHMAGHWQQMGRTKETRPYLLYLTVDDAHVREEHQRWHYILLPYEDVFWDTHYPPNDWGCRCTVVSLSQAEIDQLGLEISERPDIIRTARVNTRTGEIYPDTPEGIGVGWDYNVGKALASGPAQALASKLGTAPSELAMIAAREWTRGQAFRRWLNNPTGTVPVAVMAEVIAERMGAQTHTVLLSDQTLLKQRREHPELSNAEYALLADVVEHGEAIQDGPKSVIFLRTDDRGRVVVVKATQTGKALFVTSYRRVDLDKEVRRLRAKGERLRPEG